MKPLEEFKVEYFNQKWDPPPGEITKMLLHLQGLPWLTHNLSIDISNLARMSHSPSFELNLSNMNISAFLNDEICVHAKEY